MLILSDTDRFRVDFDQLSQGVLHSPRDGNSAAEIDIVLGEFLRRQRGGGVDGSAGLRDDHIGNAPDPAQQLTNRVFRFSGSSAVADGNVLHMMLSDQTGEGGDGFFALGFGEGGIDHGGVENLAGRVNDRHLAAVAVSGVKPHGDMTFDRRLHQQRTEVERKVVNGAFACLVGQGGTQLPFHAGGDQTVIGIIRGSADKGVGVAAGNQNGTADAQKRLLMVDFQRDLQKTFALTPVQGKHLMPLDFGQGLCKIIIKLINRGFLFLALCGNGADDRHAPHQIAKRFADRRVVGNHFRNNVRGAGKGIGHAVHAKLRIDKVLRENFGVRKPSFLREKLHGEGLQTLFLRNGRAGAALRLIGTIEILQFRKGFGAFNGRRKLRRQFALGLNGAADLIPALRQIPQILQTVSQRAQRGIVHCAVNLLAVTGNKGDGVALVEKLYDILYILQGLIQLQR